MARINGTKKDDALVGKNGDDVLKGLAGDDTLDGGKGDDSLDGGKGRDTLVASLGADTLDGGDGIDTLDASGFDYGVLVNLRTYTYTNYVGERWTVDPNQILIGNGETVDDGERQSIQNVENFVGSKFNDLFVTTLKANLVGGAGDDRLEAGAGSTVRGGAGNDRLRGEEGSFVYGDGGADDIVTNGRTAKVMGGSGDDKISFNDALYVHGGSGNDVLLFTASNTQSKIFGGTGADIFDFGYYQSGTMQDFMPGVDKVDISLHMQRVEGTWAELSTMIRDTAKGALLKLDFPNTDGSAPGSLVGQEFLFVGVEKSQLSENDFIWS